MANVLNEDKQITVISALAEGMAIRQIERMTDIHRDTIMRLVVRVGQGCARLMDEKMRGLECRDIQVDEIWGFIQKKKRNIKETDDPREVGDVWTFCAIDSETKLVPSYKACHIPRCKDVSEV
jgi:transposase